MIKNYIPRKAKQVMSSQNELRAQRWRLYCSRSARLQGQPQSENFALSVLNFNRYMAVVTLQLRDIKISVEMSAICILYSAPSCGS